MGMVTRDILAAALLGTGVVSVSYGAALISPAAGFVVLGVQLAALGATLGFWEGAPDAATDAADLSTAPSPDALPSWAEPDLGPEDADDLIPAPVPMPSPASRAPSGPTSIPLTTYLGVRSKEEAR